MLYQLSYTPKNNLQLITPQVLQRMKTMLTELVGLSRFERLTSPLSAGRSNQLSYRPQLNLSQPPIHSNQNCKKNNLSLDLNKILYHTF